MKKQIFTILFFMVFLLIIAGGVINNLQAAPNIVNISGSMNNGAQIMISGDNFGIKSPAAPVLWDNFESGSVSSSWTIVDSGWEIYSEAGQLAGATKALRCDLYGVSSYRLMKNIPLVNPMYVAVKRRWEFSQDGRNQKFFRYWDANDVENYYLAYFGNSETPTYVSNAELPVRINPANPTPGIYLSLEGGAWPVAGEWQTEELILAPDSNFSACDAIVEYRVNNLHRDRAENRCIKATPESMPLSKFYFDTFGECNGGGHACLPVGSYVWVDDVYLDDTWSRVMLADNADYESAANIEIQPPIAWNDDSIIMNLNAGSFQQGDRGYLFVFDSANNHNLSGFPITIGSSSVDTPTPKAPTSLSVL